MKSPEYSKYSKPVKASIEYMKTGNKTQAVRDTGYKESTVLSKSTDIIERGMREITETPELKKNILDKVGICSEDVVKEYSKVVLQDRDLTNKLKALTPLLKEATGIDLANSEKVAEAPTLNIHVKEITPNPNNPPQ